MLSKKLQRKVGVLVLVSQFVSVLAPVASFAAPQTVSGTDTKNALESVGTKANRLKTVGDSGVDESSGAFTYSYPLNVPKGKNGVEPGMAVSYNSQSSENSIFGYGMTFSLPYIERSARFGTDKIYTKNDFVSSVGGELILAPNSTNQYIQKIDDGSYQLYTFSNNVWTLTDRSGNIYTYGTTLDSRVSDETGTKIQKYFLTETKDTLGNKIKYFYEKKNGSVYPKEIIYTQDRFGAASNRIVFEREVRNDVEVSYKTGFRVTMDDRIKSIKMYTDNVLVGQIDFGYTTGQNGTRSLLSTISESRMGTDGLMTSVPQTKFEYEKGTNLTFQAGSSQPPGYVLSDINGDAKLEQVSLDANNNGNFYTLVDLDGNYLTDMYYNHQTNECWSGTKNTGLVRMNNNGNFFDLDIKLSKYPNLPTTHISNYPCSGESSQSFNSPTFTDLNGDGFQDTPGSMPSYLSASEYMEDINGDGLTDKIGSYSSSTNPTINGEYFFLNNGASWNDTPELNYKLPFTQKIKSSYNNDWDGGFRIVDINADGLPDLIKSWSSVQNANGIIVFLVNGPAGRGYYQPEIAVNGAQSEVYLNTGKGFIKATDVNLGGNIISNYTNSYINNYAVAPGQQDPNKVIFTGATFSGGVNTENFYDVDYNGSPDFGGGVSSFKKQDILKSITSPLGSRVDVTYKGSATGNNPNLPINMQVVDQIKETETVKNLVETTNYTFEGGKMYYDANKIYDRRFAGFKKVTTVKADQKTVKYFHQGDGDDSLLSERGDSFYNIGKTFKEELWGKENGVDTKFSESYRNYGNYIYGGQVYNYPKYEVSTSYDTQSGKLTKATSYDYDLAARLPKLVTNYGEANFDPNAGIISDIKDDAVISKNIYNTKRPQKLLSTESADVNGKFLDKKVYFYDELPFGYVERGLVTEERDYSTANVFVRKTTVYNEKGLPSLVADNNGNTTTFAYDANNNPITVINTLGQKSTSETNKWLSVQTKSIDPNGKVIQSVYDGFGRVKSISATTPDGSVKNISNKTYSYGVGFTEIENILKDGVIYKSLIKSYDTFGRTLYETESVGNSLKRTDYVYNTLGQLVSTTYPYDANGLLGAYNSVIDTKYIYDSIGRAIQITQGDNQSHITYGVSSKTTRDNSTAGHLKTYKYNSQDKIVSVTERNGQNSYTTSYTWNLLGNLTSITDAEGNVRNFVYDGEGRLLKQEDLHNPNDNKFGVYTYSYDALGNLISKTDPTLNKFSYSYDVLYRPISETTPTQTTTYIYDTCQNGAGKICTVSNSDYSQSYKYKVTGDIESETKTIDSKNFTNSYTYNSLGQVINITLPDNSVLNYSFDNNGKQKSVSLTTTNASGIKTTAYVTDATYNIDGTIREVSYGNNTKSCYNYSTSNGAVSAPRLSDIYTFAGNDCSLAATTNPNNLYVENLTYNKEGLITKNTEKYVNDTGDIVSQFTYDELNRLTATSVLEKNLTKTNSINYSPVGNIISSDSVGYSYSGADYANPHAPTTIGNKSITYDPNGNVLSDGNNVYNWSEKNTLKKQENGKSISSYVYDINGERIKEVTKVKASATETSAFSVTNDTYQTFDQALTTKVDTYVSEQTFYELDNAKLTSENKISMLFGLSYETGYPQKACVGKTDPNCQKAEAQKFVAAYLYSKYGINLTNTALEEMYSVFLGKLLVGNSVGDYLGTKSTSTDSSIYPSYSGYIYYPYGNAPTPVEHVNTNISLTGLEANKNYVSSLEYKIESWQIGDFPVDIFINGKFIKQAEVSETKQSLDLTRIVSEARIAGQTNLNVQIKPSASNTNYNYRVRVPLLQFKYNSYEYTNKINKVSNVSHALTLTTISSEVKNKENKLLYGYVYKENKIPSLFGSNKLLSKEAFTEITNLGLTYTNLVIYDRLVAYSFAPYTTCDSLSGDALYNCRKTILVKYLYAVIKYEKGVEVSTQTLEEMSEVILGNLSVPNNTEEYKVRETKSYTINQVERMTGIEIWGNNQVNTQNVFTYGNPCSTGGFLNGYSTTYFACELPLQLPTEIKTRAKEVEGASILLKLEQGRLNQYQTTHSPGSLYIYPVVDTTGVYWSGTGITASTFYNWNTDKMYSSPEVVIDFTKETKVDVSKVMFAAANLQINYLALRLISTADHVKVTNAGVYTLEVKYAKDADQMLRSYVTPLVTNPKDSAIENNILSVLARVDKDYVGNASTVVSRDSYEEVKNSAYITNDKVKEIFDQNEKLQKDDTLAAVWSNYKQNYSQELTRESLEELFMVWKGNLSMPTDYDQYMYITSTSTKVLATIGSSTLKSYVTVSKTVASTENGVNYLTFYLDPNFKVFDRSKMTNLSVVPGVFSLRYLGDEDLIIVKKAISEAGFAELGTVGVTKREDLFQFTTTVPGFDEKKGISKMDKISVLSKINSEIVRIKNIKLSREVLEEIYYIINNKMSLQPGVSVSQTVEIPGVVSNYKFQGAVNSADKKKDELRPTKSIYMENTTTSVTGRKGEADGGYGFVGNGYVLAPNFSPIPTNGSYTFSTWVKTSGSSDSLIMQMGAPSTPYNYIRLQYWRNLINTEVVSGGSFTTYNVGKKTINDNKWHKIDFVLDNTGPVKSTVYIDGVKDSETTFTGKHNFSNIADEILIGAGRNPGAGNRLEGYFNGQVDEYKVWNRALTETDIKNSYDNDNGTNVVTENLETFERSKFGVLEPVESSVSTNETKLTNNVTYNIKDSEVKVVSDETKGELGLVGITTRQQIVDIMQKTPVVLKDSKIHFFREYIKQNNGFELSREALEEVYLIYSERELFALNPEQLVTLRESVTNTLVESKNGNLTGNNCSSIGTTAELYYPVYTCSGEIKITQKYGYRVTKAQSTLAGTPFNLSNTYIKASVMFKDTYEDTSIITDLAPYYPLNTNGTYRINYRVNGGYINQMVGMTAVTVNTVYEPISEKQDRSNFASLEDVSPYSALKKSYDTEVASLNVTNTLPTSSTTTIPQLSAETQKEIASTTIKTVTDVKNIFATATSTWSKDTKLSHFFLKTKQASGVELTRAALEEMWNVNSGTETIYLQATTTTPVVATTSVTKSYNFNKSTYTVWTENGNNMYDQTWCMVLAGYPKGECYYKFSFTPESGSTVKSATINYNYYFYGGASFDATFYRPTTQPQNRARPAVVEYPEYKWTIVGTGASQLISKDITKLISESASHGGYLYIGIGKTSAQPILYWPTVQMVQAQSDGYGGIYGLKDPTLTVVWEKAATSSAPVTPPPTFDRSTISSFLVGSTMDQLSTSYASTTGVSLSTINNLVNGTSTLQSFCNSTLETCTVPTTTLTEEGELATTTTLLDLLQTNVVEETNICNIHNPYSYPFTTDSNCIATFILPSGATTTDGTVKEYNTLAKNLNDWRENGKLGVNDSIYVKYFPSTYYEYDNRGVSTINITFNGKVVGTYRYNEIGTLGEVSYLHNNYQGSPVVVTNELATTTQVIKQDAWGVQTSSSFIPDSVLPTSVGYTGHKWDSDSELTYAHARYLNNQNRVWLSHDPFSINNFSNSTWLLSPQIQNSYSYTANNPVNRIDPDGQKPTVQEAAAMADDIYNPGNRGANLNGWKLDVNFGTNGISNGGRDAQMGYYSRTKSDGSMEYTIAFRGTQSGANWIDNFQQGLGKSPDAKWAIDSAASFKESCKKCDDITSVGHSKGGAEASLAGVRINVDVIVFNPAHANYAAYEGVDINGYTSQMDNYIVEGEILDGVSNSFSSFVASLHGNTHSLVSPYRFEPNPIMKEKFKNWPERFQPKGQVITAVDKHFMGTVNMSFPKK